MRIVTVAMMLAALAAWPAAAQAAPPAAEPYRPGLGDLMTMTVQPRHIKLALAGREGNWPYAKYELHELAEAFDRVTRYGAEVPGIAVGRHGRCHRQGTDGGDGESDRRQEHQNNSPAPMKAHRRLQRLPPGRQCRAGGDQRSRTHRVSRTRTFAAEAMRAFTGLRFRLMRIVTFDLLLDVGAQPLKDPEPDNDDDRGQQQRGRIDRFGQVFACWPGTRSPGPR